MSERQNALDELEVVSALTGDIDQLVDRYSECSDEDQKNAIDSQISKKKGIIDSQIRHILSEDASVEQTRSYRLIMASLNVTYGSYAYERNYFPEAIEYYTKALELGGDDHGTIYMVALCYKYLGIKNNNEDALKNALGYIERGLAYAADKENYTNGKGIIEARYNDIKNRATKFRTLRAEIEVEMSRISEGNKLIKEFEQKENKQKIMVNAIWGAFFFGLFILRWNLVFLIIAGIFAWFVYKRIKKD